MPSGKLTIDYLPLISLRLDPKNARLHTDKQLRQIARSIEVFGFNVPILVDADLRVVAGHGRLLAGRLLGIADVPVIRLEHLSENQLRAFMLADNKLAENSEWDKRILAEQLMTLSQAELDFSVTVTGFEVGEINLIIENVAPASRSKNDPADSIPDLGTQPHVSRVGDLWILGRHRVFCGDARNENSYAVLMGDCRAHMAFTDPRYSNPRDRYLTGPPEIHGPQSTTPSGEVMPSEFFTFWTTVSAYMARNTVEGSFHFICMDWRRSEELISAARSVYSEFNNVCVWIKDGAEQGSLYGSQHELIFVFKSGKKSHCNDIELAKGRRHRTNVWRYPSVNSPPSNPASSTILCPTTKPVELVADAILDGTARGNVVLDPFVGTGTTVIAAERTGRLCFGMELEPALVDMAVRRWQSFTGHSAVHDVTRDTFTHREREAADGCK